MSLLRNIATGLRSLFRKEQVDRELDEELGASMEMKAAEKMKCGMSRKEAVRGARRAPGAGCRHSLLMPCHCDQVQFLYRVCFCRDRLPRRSGSANAWRYRRLSERLSLVCPCKQSPAFRPGKSFGTFRLPRRYVLHAGRVEIGVYPDPRKVLTGGCAGSPIEVGPWTNWARMCASGCE